MNMGNAKLKKDQYAIGIAKINKQNPILNFKKNQSINSLKFIFISIL
jgi:hypothetical protein